MKAKIERVARPPALPVRSPDGHKGQMGRILIVGGSRGMIGAPALAANAALRAGAGLVTVAAPAPVQLHVAVLCPCATSMPLACDARGRLSPAAAGEVAARAAEADVLVVGCGLATGTPQQMLVRSALTQPRPLVLDADGLNALCEIPDWPALCGGPLVLTPHPGEMARLLGRSVADVQADREGLAVETARDWARQCPTDTPSPVLVLKGAGTVVTDGERVYVNDTGNPGMATGGSGDVLTGVIAAVIGQGLPPFEAACLGARTHGAAGDAAAEALGEVSLIATDIIDHLPQAITGTDTKTRI